MKQLFDAVLTSSMSMKTILGGLAETTAARNSQIVTSIHFMTALVKSTDHDKQTFTLLFWTCACALVLAHVRHEQHPLFPRGGRDNWKTVL